ncbi:hypothetical protein P2H44_21350 [Albimonas sp. CAU 1670]|uniref:hypothetical protein n=1 Tax=Albimonas sp. CAU 1670 TaxID=3032599 RepID=UPI0023DBCBC1|nr:hypothetical protein [Albimonas sp. CAU 1670]MDF2235112.1 hypothetical protein [Albimonas sp. CAU 1670]
MTARATSPILALALAAALLAPAPAARACAFDGALPPLTLVDRLFDADALVVAAPDPDDPTRWRLLDAPAPVSASMDAPDPAAFLAAGADARPRALRPDEAVVFAHDPVDDEWRRLGTFGRVTLPVVRRIIDAAQGWDGPEDPARFHLAATLSGDRDLRVRRLALSELDRASYRDLRALDLPLDAAALIEMLSAADSAPVEPILALLLGLTGEPRARALIEGRIRAAAPGEAAAPVLGAWAAALIEIDGPEGVDAVAAHFFSPDPAEASPAWSVARLAPVMEALAIQADAGPPDTRDRVHAAVAAALETRPDLAGAVARSFSAREDWSLAAPMQTALSRRAGLPAADAIAAAAYLFAARDAARSGGDAAAVGLARD